MVYKSEQSTFEKLVVTAMMIMILLSAGFVILRFFVPGVFGGPADGVHIIDVPGQVDPVLEQEF
jgi:hypothetical protein